MKLLLGIPTAGAPSAPFLASLRALQFPDVVTAFDRYVVTGNFPPAQRELILRHAFRVGADIVVMLDDDMLVPPDGLVRLCAALEQDPQAAAVGALYYTRDGIRPVVAAAWSSHNTATAVVPAFADRLVQVDGVGFGCVALRVASAGMLRSPYFSAQIYIEESAARVRLANEDFLFCERLRAAGFTVYLDAGARCKHFDRVTQTALPVVWEPVTATNHERMLVVDPGPTYRLIPSDAALGTTQERHETVQIEYLFVE